MIKKKVCSFNHQEPKKKKLKPKAQINEDNSVILQNSFYNYFNCYNLYLAYKL